MTQNYHMCTEYFYIWVFTNFNCNIIIFTIYQYFNIILAQFRKKLERHFIVLTLYHLKNIKKERIKLLKKANKLPITVLYMAIILIKHFRPNVTLMAQ